MSVSYTHLDVYKRQRYGLASPSVVVVEIFRRHDLSPLSLHVQLVRHLRLPGGEQLSVAVSDVYALMPHPVSYTHLDVYKRQV